MTSRSTRLLIKGIDMKRGFVKKAIKTAAGAAAIMLVLGVTKLPEQEEIVEEPRYGISMERYIEEKAAELREEETLTAVRLRDAEKPQKVTITKSEEQMLLKLTMAEAGGEDLEGKALVMRVVLNRVLDPAFPSTVEGVICQVGQFSPLWDGRYYDMVPDDDCYIALSMVQGGWDKSYGATYFRTNMDGATWHSENLTTLFTHGGHTFFKEA